MGKQVEESNFAAYLRSLERDMPDKLRNFEKECRSNFVPVIRAETQSLLKVLLAVKRPERILEVGSGVGFSAVYMAHFSGARITTIEHDPDRIREAGENIRRFGMEDRIRLLPGEAEEILPALTGSYDLIFLDAAKAQYGQYLPHLLRLLVKDGLLITDNVLRSGELLDSRYAVERRERTIHKRLREYLKCITEHPDLTTGIFPGGDGTAVSVKKGRTQRTDKEDYII